MHKHIPKQYLYTLPSGVNVHPCRLIVKDGTLMWKQALLMQNKYLFIPESLAHEAHIIKTAQRVEDLNTWLIEDLNPWESLIPHYWYYPEDKELSEGIALYMKHFIHSNDYVLEKLTDHLQEHEALTIRDDYLFFKRC